MHVLCYDWARHHSPNSEEEEEDIHAGYTSKVEGFQCHLCAWFPNALGSHCPYGCTRLNASPHELVHTRCEELLQLSFGDPLDLIQNWTHKHMSHGMQVYTSHTQLQLIARKVSVMIATCVHARCMSGWAVVEQLNRIILLYLLEQCLSLDWAALQSDHTSLHHWIWMKRIVNYLQYNSSSSHALWTVSTTARTQLSCAVDSNIKCFN